MYLPAHFTWTDLASQAAFCRDHAFATLVAIGSAGPEAQHLPLLVDVEDGRLVLRGHAAVGNPLWQATRALAIFTGPHAYVSATWYGEPNMVPTWNYLAVHASGPLRVIADPAEVRSCFAQLSAQDPQHAVWESQLNPATYEKLAAAIRWFRIDIDHIDAKAKLSQNHSPERRQRVIEHLQASSDPAMLATGQAMARTLAGQQPWGDGGPTRPARSIP